MPNISRRDAPAAGPREVMLHTTFALLRKQGACESGYRKLAKRLGGVRTYGRNQLIPLSVVLDSNGISYAIWCLGSTTEPCDRFARLLAVNFVRQVLHLMTDPRSLAALDAAERRAWGKATDKEIMTTRVAASDAARGSGRYSAEAVAAWAAVATCTLGDASKAARIAASCAAWAAANAAARAAAKDAAWAAAWVAARDAARDAQADILREMLGNER